MSVNNMTFEQAATLLNAVHSQVTGMTQIAPADVTDFISVAQKTLKAGYDPVLNANASVRVAVIDTGSNLANESYSVVGDDPADYNGHGTSSPYRTTRLLILSTVRALICTK